MRQHGEYFSTISLAVTTDLRTYRRMATSDTGILPGKSAYSQATIQYADAAEVLKEEGIAIDDQHYQ